MRASQPQAVLLASARVGGILASQSHPVDFLYDNLLVEANLIRGAAEIGVEKPLFLGAPCIYPRFAKHLIIEEKLLAGPLEPANEWSAVAKIAGIKLCQAYHQHIGLDYISAMPTNRKGPGDSCDLNSSHVLPALLRKAHDAQVSGAPSMEIWSTGVPRRGFLHFDDCTDALVFLMQRYSKTSHVNVGFGEDLSVRELAEMIVSVVGFDGDLTRDLTKPNGTPRKLMSVERLQALGWRPSIPLLDRLKSTYAAALTE